MAIPKYAEAKQHALPGSVMLMSGSGLGSLLRKGLPLLKKAGKFAAPLVADQLAKEAGRQGAPAGVSSLISSVGKSLGGKGVKKLDDRALSNLLNGESSKLFSSMINRRGRGVSTLGGGVSTLGGNGLVEQDAPAPAF